MEAGIFCHRREARLSLAAPASAWVTLMDWENGAKPEPVSARPRGGRAQPRRSAAGIQARWWKNVMRPLIQPWTMSPAAAGLETIHTINRTATMTPMTFANNGLASHTGSAAAVLWRSDVPASYPTRSRPISYQPARRLTPSDSLMAPLPLQ